METEIIKYIDDWEIETPNGWSNFLGIKKIEASKSCRIYLKSGSELEGALTHKIKLESNEFVELQNVEVGDTIKGGDIIVSKEYFENSVKLYDILGVDLDNEYISNGVVNHNCAFIENVEETYAAAQQTLATGGFCIALSTPNGVGNWFHKTWEKAELGENSFTAVKLPWEVHPERDQSWRDKQDKDLGPRLAAQECDTDFLSSGETVLEPEDLIFLEQSHLQTPSERRGLDSNLWIWELPDYTRSYMVVADVARGDGADFSAFHVFDIETMTQVAEYKGKITPKDYGNLLVGIGSEYNDALLVVENTGVGWATVEQILTREYKNFYYSAGTNTDTVESYMAKMEQDRLTPGFTNSASMRPLLVAKLIEYIRDREVIIRSKRTINELRVFIWRNGKAQSQPGYNDDLTISLAIALYVRDTALKLRQQGLDLTRAQLSTMSSINHRSQVIVTRQDTDRRYDSYKMKTGRGDEDITWLLG